VVRTPLFTLVTAWRALGRHRMRTALTMLGISIGIAAVVTMVSIGQGAKLVVLERLASVGDNMLFVEAGNRQVQGVTTSKETMMYEDVVAIRKECPAVAHASPHVNFRAQVASGGRNWNTQIRGIDPDYQIIRQWPIVDGEFLQPDAFPSLAKVAVLGQAVVKELFSAATSPVGQTIRVGGTPFKVVGVLAPKGGGLMGEDQDDLILIPWTTAQRKMLGIKYIKDMYISAVTRDSIDAAKEQITAVMRLRHHLMPEQPDDFSIRDYTEIADQVNETNRQLTLLLSSVASIALLVGGINIMTIMLVSVTERTREIGVRMAVGARSWQVRLQFLLEAVLLTLAGGLAGVGLGVGAAFLTADAMEMRAVVSPPTVGVGLGISTVVGLLFGYWPALRASRLQPIEALRSD
jgi:putative ABC transport system permease protein